MTNEAVQKIRDEILEAALPQVVFDGWSVDALETAANLAGHKPGVVRAVFHEPVLDAVDGFADWADRKMADALAEHNPEEMRIRDRVREAVLARLTALAPYKEAVRHSVSYWAYPTRGLRASKIVWRTADRIWDWAGDTATDYNRYTKRGLLSGILVSTTLVWLDDDSDDIMVTEAFLDRRIEDVMQIGKLMGKIKR